MPAPRLLERLFVTGGAGFMGSTLLRHLLERPGTRVLNYDALTYAGLRESVELLDADSRYRFIHGDVLDCERLAKAIADFQPDTLIHLAAESHVDRSITKPEVFVRTNVEGTANVLRVWQDYSEGLPNDDERLLVHVSTDEVYGSMAADRRAKEGDPYAPSSPYSATKAAADHLVQAYRRTYGQRSILVYPTNNYGSRQFPEKLIPLATLRALRGEPIPLYGDGLQVRDWLHVDDNAAGLIAAAVWGEAGEGYHLGATMPGDREWTNRQIVETICDAVDEFRPAKVARRKLIQQVTDRPGHDRRYALDSSLSREELSWSPKVDLREGIRQTVRWYMENPDWVEAADRRGRELAVRTNAG